MSREKLKNLVIRVAKLDEIIENCDSVFKHRGNRSPYEGTNLCGNPLRDEEELEKTFYRSTVKLRDELNEQIDNFCK